MHGWREEFIHFMRVGSDCLRAKVTSEAGKRADRQGR